VTRAFLGWNLQPHSWLRDALQHACSGTMLAAVIRVFYVQYKPVLSVLIHVNARLVCSVHSQQCSPCAHSLLMCYRACDMRDLWWDDLMHHAWIVVISAAETGGCGVHVLTSGCADLGG
jgi:hypothetical protein